MKKADIKIVGSISDENQLDEIQSIAKIFVYEQRMKCFKYPIKDNDSLRKNYMRHYKKTDNRRKNMYDRSTILMVRGLS